MAIQLNTSDNSAASVVSTFESNLKEGERVLAFNLNPSKSQTESGPAGEKRKKTYWTSTGSSFMYGEHGAFGDAKVLVAAHLWDGNKYIAPPLYGQDASGAYKVLSSAEPTGLAGEMYGFYLATLDDLIDQLEQASNKLVEEIEAGGDEESLFAQIEELTIKQSEVIAKKTNIKAFFELCGVQKSVELPGLTLGQMISTWKSLTKGEKQVLKIKCVISYQTEGKFDISLKVIEVAIENGYLIPATRGQAINQEESQFLRDKALKTFAESKTSVGGVMHNVNSTLKALETVKVGSEKTQARNRYRMEQKARAKQLEATPSSTTPTESSEQSEAVKPLVPSVDNLNDLDFADLDATI